MAWTAPRTWTDGELVTAAIMNPHVRDNFNASFPHLIVRKTSDESDATGTVQNDDVLLAALLANEIWQFRFNLLVVAASTTDFKAQLTFPSGSISAIGFGATGGSFTGDGISAATSPSGVLTIQTTSTVSNHVLIEGVVSNGATPGNLQLQWSGNTAVTCTVKVNSTLWAVKLA